MLVLAAPLAAQTDAREPAGDTASQLAGLNETLEDIRTLLAQRVELRNLDLLLQRAKMAAAEVTRLDNLLRDARADRAEYEELQLELDAHIEHSENDPEIPDDVRVPFIRRLREMKVSTAQNLRRTEAEIVDLETRLTRQQQDLDEWQELLDRRLGGV